MAKSDLRLNSVFLKNRVAELSIKQWWLAEQIGVDRKTVIRWIQGQVRAIQLENAEKLATILGCQISDLSTSGGIEQLATIEDQKNAAAAIRTSSLFDKLGPIGEWDILESLLKATIVHDLPLNVLGELDDKLTIASWRQSKIDQAAIYNSVTEDIARRTDDRSLLAAALLSKANIFSWRGETLRSISTYRECLNLEAYLKPRVRGSIHSNLGGVLYESGELEMGEAEIRKSIKIFQSSGLPMNLAIAHTHLALIALLNCNFDEAEREIRKVLDFSKPDDFRRGLYFANLLAAEVAAARGDSDAATTVMEAALQNFEKMGIVEGLNFEIAARSMRRIRNFERARQLAERGISISDAFPIYQAALYRELAEILFAQNLAFETAARNSIKLYQKHDCPRQVEALKKHFKIE